MIRCVDCNQFFFPILHLWWHWVQLCLMLQNDIGENNDNDGFIIPMTPITPAAGNSPTSPLSPRRSRPRRTSKYIPTPDYTEQGGEGFISYRHFRWQYWDHLPQSLTWGLGVYTIYLALIIGNFWGRSCFGFWSDSGGYQRFWRGHWHTAEVFGPRCLPIHQQSRSTSPYKGSHLWPFHCIYQDKTTIPGVWCSRSVSST